MENTISKAKRSIKLYPIFYTFSADLIFFVPIDTLFLTLVKGMNASQISAMTTISLLVCILSRKLILKTTQKIGNVKSIQLGALMLLIASLILTLGKSFTAMLIYHSVYELAFMFWGMSSILLRNNLSYINEKEKYYTLRNKAKIMYGISTMVTALISGWLFNINSYLPVYISIIIHFIILLVSFNFYEAKVQESNFDNKKSKGNNQINLSTTILFIILSNAVFFSLIKTGQNNSKLFMQYDFQNILSAEMVTYYITTIVFISRIARILGNVIFGKIYLKIKERMSKILTFLLSMAFLLLILGHLLPIKFIFKVIIMSVGFFMILATRDSFQVYIEDVALNITDKESQQKILINIEVYRKIGTLILSTIFTLILLKYELIVVEFILLTLAIIEIFINKRLCTRLEKIGENNENN